MADSLLIQLLKNGRHPTGGGTLCLAGDCPNCLALVDGVAYVRTCQQPADPAADIVPYGGPAALPPLESGGSSRHVDLTTVHCDVVVIGQGPAGRAEAASARAAGQHVETVDSAAGEEAIGIYPGPLVVVRTPAGLRHLRPRGEIIVATGAADVLPVVPGSHLRGLVTARAIPQLASAGLALGRVVAVGDPPDGIAHTRVQGRLVRFDASSSDPTTVGAVVTITDDGVEHRLDADTVSLGLGLVPRDALLRMGRGMNVRGVGDVVAPAAAVAAPTAGVVCPCLQVTVDDLASVFDRGFHDLELVKRATLAGTGPCQGVTCMPHVRAWLEARLGQLPPPFTARPLTRSATMAEVAAGAHHAPTLRTPLDAWHRNAGAVMERMGGWWRPWHYGNPDDEYTAVRTAVSLGDVSTLGKMTVAGPDAPRLLEHLYPVPVAPLKTGRLRYTFLLDERGYVIDDGLVCRDADDRFYLTFTSGGATHAEAWVRDWADSLGADVRLLNETMSLGAINVTGPLAAQVLAAVGAEGLPPFGCHAHIVVAGVACRVLRLSFTGEVSYELHHPAADTMRLWRALLDAGAAHGIRPHGLQALLTLRLEKGHVIVGQDTDFDSTLRRIDAEWAVSGSKPAFVGRDAVHRTNALPRDRRLCGFEMDAPAPLEGAVIHRADGTVAGVVTSSAWSPVLQRSVLLGWLGYDGDRLPDAAFIDGREARRVSLPFYDPEGTRARA